MPRVPKSEQAAVTLPKEEAARAAARALVDVEREHSHRQYSAVLRPSSAPAHKEKAPPPDFCALGTRRLDTDKSIQEQLMVLLNGPGVLSADMVRACHPQLA